MSETPLLKKQISFKDFKGLKQIDTIKNNYKIAKVLGQGSFGKVYLAMNRNFENQVAIKVIKKSQVNKHAVYKDLLINELIVLEKTEHPHITRVLEICED
jgi:serine/threonine protein kinase